MKIGIKYRLFFGMLAATAAVILCMWLIMQWSMNRGFMRYINTQEMERLEVLAGELEQSYARHGSWDFLRTDPDTWVQILIRSLPPGTADPERIRRLEKRLARPAAESTPDAEDADSTRVSWLFERRVLLLDAAHRPLITVPGAAAPADIEELRHRGDIVGYLGLVARPRTYDSRQLQFVQQQKLTQGLIAAAALLVSALISLPLASRLVRPIKTLAEATERLSTGHYTTRVPDLATGELAQLARNFNTLALTLEKNEQSRRQWVADISHELRTPLAVLRGEIEALQDGIRPTTAATLGSLHAETLHLGRLIEDLYQLSLSDLGALTYHKQKIDLVDALGDALASFRGPFQEKAITLIEDGLARPPLIVSADAERLHQLFCNLLDNALKYTDSGGSVAVDLTREKNRVIIELHDSAPGVPAAELERIFDRLYRLEGSRRRASGGAGLGLAICRNIVDAHEGRITALPSPSGGVCIRIELPTTDG
ncbi:MAG: ATP-binding protein [Pelovirga sp.]